MIKKKMLGIIVQIYQSPNLGLTSQQFLYVAEHTFLIKKESFWVRIRELSTNLIDFLSILPVLRLLKRLFVLSSTPLEDRYILASNKQQTKNTDTCWETT